MVLPRVSANVLAGLMESLNAPPFEGKADLPALAEKLHLEVDELFPIAEVAPAPALRRTRRKATSA